MSPNRLIPKALPTYDIFCDASVGPNLRGACAGCLVTNRMNNDTYFTSIIQPNGTNNSGEIAAIALGLTEAIKIYNYNPEPACYNIFSDSMIGISSVREWIFTWIQNMKHHTLYKSDGKVVMNQSYVKLIYNLITSLNFPISFYHQKGHVNNAFDKAEIAFNKTNPVTLREIGLTPSFISICNDMVDKQTRTIINEYLNTGFIGNSRIDNMELIPINMRLFDVSVETINRYRKLIGADAIIQ